MSDDENIVVATAERIFADLANSQEIIHAKGDTWKQPLWRALADAGLPLAWVPEAHGGSGASLMDGFGVLRAAGRSAVAVPLAETMLAGWLLSQGGIIAPEGMMTVAPSGPRDRVHLGSDGLFTGRARKVPFARDAAHLAVLTSSDNGWMVALVAAEQCAMEAGCNLAGDYADTVIFSGVRPGAVAPAPAGFDLASFLLMGSVVRSQQMSGALETMLDISVRYSTERIAFEKTISKYQAVQHNLARLGGEVAAAVTAATSAADALAARDNDPEAIFLEAASAKIRCGEAADKGSAIAHQVHGAIGFTSEHVLHRLTLRALAWRDDFGAESYWATELGTLVGRRGADDLWPLVASR
jgi:acyl-CoA dehydrogenase